ncbi:MAG: geranylgeranyl reductase family protein [Hydrococcus sp. C42_A2020_068]|uniref:geranylgeranyl reductase family protein n=1 Tax=Pleurocapsa sp. PCC 7327 TaxID=118163 RepID=UPI00029FF221|nr:geranylgeranyl reductase family protein [Pleurocapsa sp. PCC 7327]AFY79389.1 geranylgeranyl reductase family protein [Pleurocapsa sp. PCC 7327]MBF2020114.1 geranylgeranyl reductase family protein [Hydrococcus sp. C42_A2020_068]
MFDCIVVGAGPAGATAAYHLAKLGRSVLVLEKVALPRYKPCGGGVSPAIAKWFDFDFTPVINNTITKVQYTWKMGDPMETELNMKEPMWMVKRDEFDNYLIEQVQQKGARVKDNTEVKAISPNSQSWQVNTSDGIYEASYLIAADGGRSLLTQLLGLKPRQEFLGATLEVKTAVPADKQHTAYFDFGTLKNGYIWNFPKADGYSLSAGCMRGKTKPDELKKHLTDYAKAFGIDLANSRYSDYSLSLWTENQPLHANRAVIAGEAAGILDPLSGEGIRPSIFTGMKAAEAIDRAIAGDGQALANYTQVIAQEWGSDMVLAHRLAGLFYQFPKIAYKFGVKRPTAAQVMAKILCGELRYGDITEYAMQRLKKSLIPGMGN